MGFKSCACGNYLSVTAEEAPNQGDCYEDCPGDADKRDQVGNSTRKCGGPFRVNVYTTGYGESYRIIFS